MFSNTLSFLSSRNVGDQVSHPYKTTGKIIVLYILIFKFLYKSYTGTRNKFQNNGMLLQSFYIMFHKAVYLAGRWRDGLKYLAMLHTCHFWWCLFMEHVPFVVLSRMGEMRVFFIGKAEEKRPMRKLRLIWEFNIKIDLQEV